MPNTDKAPEGSQDKSPTVKEKEADTFEIHIPPELRPPSESEVLDEVIETTKYAPAPTTMDELLALSAAEGKAQIEQKAELERTARRCSIQETFPNDWVLFYNFRTGGIFGYLQDAGCQRIRNLWGIESFPDKPEKTTVEDEFAYSYIGDAVSHLTGQRIRNMEGCRTSGDRFIQKQDPPLSPIMLEMRVKQLARANYDGNCVRRLAGLSMVPLEEIEAVWAKSDKKKSVYRCPLAKGWGEHAQNWPRGIRPDALAGAPASQAAAKAKAPPPTAEKPVCDKCGGSMNYMATGKYGPWWGCSNFRSTECKGAISQDAWEKKLKTLKSGAAPKKTPPEQVVAEDGGLPL